MGRTCRASCLVLLLVAVVLKGSFAKFIYGKEADKLCRAYRKVCPRAKLCAIQILKVSGKTIKFPVCVHQFEVKVRSPICQEAPSPGRCSAQFRRWYFNVHMAACSWFTYSGCGGNDNNFRSREECDTMCVVRPDEDDVSATRQPDPLRLRHEDVRHQENGRHSSLSSTPGGNSPVGGDQTSTTPVENSASSAQNYAANQNRSGSYSSHKTPHRGAESHEQSTFDIHGAPYMQTSATPVTDRLLRHDVSTFGQPQELRRPPAENYRRIVKRPSPVYHPESRVANAPAALHAHRSMPSLSGKPSDETRRLAEYPDRRLANFSDKSRPLRENENVGELVEESAGLAVVSQPRDVPQRLPHRVLSLLSRGSPHDDTPDHAPDRYDVRAALTSSYAPDANETIRRFPPRRRLRKRRKNRHLNRRRSRRRRRRNRRRGRKNRTRQGRKVWKHDVTSRNSVPESVGSQEPWVTETGAGESGQLAEFRRQKTAYFLPARPHHSNGDSDSEIRGEKKRRRGRARRRRQRKGRGGWREETTADNERNSSSVAQGDNKYYDRIHLFGLLGRAVNENALTE
ncbi:hypothetical protein ACOMHN_013968 [Nucella lapillus]